MAIFNSKLLYKLPDIPGSVIAIFYCIYPWNYINCYIIDLGYLIFQ